MRSIEKHSLLDINFKNFSMDEKRVSFMRMDLMMKSLHEKGLMIINFDPKNIYYQDGIYFFDKIIPIKDSYIDKEKAIRSNIEDLADLAFATYLPEYSLSNGLLNKDVISEKFYKFTSIFNAKDISYYRGVLVDSKVLNTIPEPMYYSDYLLKQNEYKEQIESDRVNSRRKVLATEAGMGYLKDDNKAAFSTMFFFILAILIMIMMIAVFIMLM